MALSRGDFLLFTHSTSPEAWSGPHAEKVHKMNDLQLEQPARARGPSQPRRAPRARVGTPARGPVAFVTVSWGTYVLAVKPVGRGESFALGEGGFLPLDAGILGANRLDLVHVAPNGRVELVRHAGLHGSVTRGATTATLDVFADEGFRVHRDAGDPNDPNDSNDPGDPGRLVLPHGAEVELTLAGSLFSVRIAVGAEDKPLPAGLATPGNPWVLAMAALSLALHGTLLGVFVMHRGTLEADENGPSDRDQILFMRAALDHAAERELERPEPVRAEPTDDVAPAGGSSQAAKGPAGQSGSLVSKATHGAFAVQGPTDNPDPHVAATRLRDEAASFGMLGLLNTALANSGPESPFELASNALGRDAASANGSLFDADPGDRFGLEGLGALGPGSGGGADGDFVGLDPHGIIRRGSGGGPNFGIGPRSTGGEGGSHRPRGPSLRTAQVETNGRLPAEVIQRAVRQQMGRLRLCYLHGVTKNPTLAGRVAVKFVISREGSVTLAQDGGSDLPDAGVIACVVRAFADLSFAESPGGLVTVTYPIIFSPGN